ncbi:hypothetical protein [Gimesia aquarii]|uniref:Uncharacterized protein n=1 Tax=Gimesia aquarii TaxID=2527964 RepID=A0A517VYF0_9PLAN|nr:hypothetical protein [Gimesia aquarii]QDT98025.1 hypothetical protein V144x_35090 [Gimesia aquarii]
MLRFIFTMLFVFTIIPNGFADEVRDYNRKKEKQGKQRIRDRYPNYYVGFSRTIHARDGARATAEICLGAMGATDRDGNPLWMETIKRVSKDFKKDVDRIDQEAKEVGVDISREKPYTYGQIWVKHREGNKYVYSETPRSWIFFVVYRLSTSGVPKTAEKLSIVGTNEAVYLLRDGSEVLRYTGGNEMVTIDSSEEQKVLYNGGDRLLMVKEKYQMWQFKNGVPTPIFDSGKKWTKEEKQLTGINGKVYMVKRGNQFFQVKPQIIRIPAPNGRKSILHTNRLYMIVDNEKLFRWGGKKNVDDFKLIANPGTTHVAANYRNKVYRIKNGTQFWQAKPRKIRYSLPYSATSIAVDDNNKPYVALENGHVWRIRNPLDEHSPHDVLNTSPERKKLAFANGRLYMVKNDRELWQVTPRLRRITLR